MDYLEWLINKEESSDEEIQKVGKKRSYSTEIQNLLSEANIHYVKNDFNKSKEKLKELLQISPRVYEAYYTLGLMYEEQQVIEKAYQSFFIAAHIKKNDLELWKKVYEYSSILQKTKEKIYCICFIQKIENSKSLVLEKIEGYKVLEQKEKEIETLVELIEFEGYDIKIFNDIETLKSTSDLIRISKKINHYISKMYNNREFEGFIPLDEYFIEKAIDLSFKLRDYKCLKDFFESFCFKFYDSISFKHKTYYFICMNHINEAEKIDEDTLIWVDKNKTPIFKYFIEEINESHFQDFENLLVLVELIYKKKSYSTCLEILERMKNAIDSQKSNYQMTVAILTKVALIYTELNNKEYALKYYLKVLEIEPENEHIRTLISNLYKECGNIEMALFYSTSLTNQEIFIGETKKDHRYNLDNCKNMRMLYFKALDAYEKMNEINKEEKILFINTSNILIKDFLNNFFVFVPPKGNFKAYLEKSERQKGEVVGLEDFDFEDLIYDKKYFGKEEEVLDLGVLENSQLNSNLCSREKRRLSIRLMCLHGLTVDEWFNILKKYILYNIELFNVDDSISLLDKILEASIFKSRNDLFLQIAFLGLKYSLLFNLMDNFVGFIKKLAYNYQSNKIYFLLYFFSNFFIDYIHKKEYYRCMKNIQRVEIRKIRKFILESDKTSETFLENNLNNKIEECFLFLCSYTPKILFSETVSYIENLPLSKLEDELEIGILLASIFFSHSKSRKVKNRNMYIKKGFGIFKKIEDKINNIEDKNKKLERKQILYYNIGRAYHQFNILGFAESYYKKCLESENKEIKMLSVFNLSLIYQKNNSVMQWKSLMKSFNIN